MLESIFQYYLENKEELLRLYEGKFILINNKKIKGAFSSKIDAYNYGIKRYYLGTFLVQECSPEVNVITIIFEKKGLIPIDIIKDNI